MHNTCLRKLDLFGSKCGTLENPCNYSHKYAGYIKGRKFLARKTSIDLIYE